MAASWDGEYAAGRYAGAPPDGFVTDIVAALPRTARYDLVIGIQVFQHGRQEQATRQLADAAAMVRPGGLFCVRVNAAGTDIEYDHDRFEEDERGGYTVRYRAGPKTGLDIHFFTAAELASLVPRSFA